MILKMTSAQVVETSVIVNNNSSFENYTNPDDHTQQTTDIPGFKPFTVQLNICWLLSVNQADIFAPPPFAFLTQRYNKYHQPIK